jgi:hypothetical protein
MIPCAASPGDFDLLPHGLRSQAHGFLLGRLLALAVAMGEGSERSQISSVKSWLANVLLRRGGSTKQSTASTLNSGQMTLTVGQKRAWTRPVAYSIRLSFLVSGHLTRASDRAVGVNCERSVSSSDIVPVNEKGSGQGLSHDGMSAGQRPSSLNPGAALKDLSNVHHRNLRLVVLDIADFDGICRNNLFQSFSY